ncbi:diguanylate cyclase [Neorhodopirellula lusitana]|uniref:diguanylate cyclase n=1 Tax=Neorhodopirellula lusitana TaxID=445327 RepID=A0ABY1PXX5_9BACT|nr:GGDEF domain-containing protein [Neorhodopirellula lusitana]SMP51888.1 diguanylate cyclase [Neorhodopirellula lusitana]
MSTANTTPFDIAKQALAHVGRFRTPPTPNVYEVWYRYVEGVDDIIANLSHAVDHVNAVSVEMLDQLHDQYCVPVEVAGERMADELISEMSSLHSVVQKQIQVGADFGDSINQACGALSEANPSPETVSDCSKALLVSNAVMQEHIQELQAQLIASQTKVENLQHELVESQRATMTDPLTGLGNRRHFEVGTRKSIASDNRESRHIVLFVIDIDYFKTINDTFGHESGDKVIMYVASQLARHCPDALISRIGGDEFAIIVDVSDYIQAKELADTVRKFFASTPLKLSESGKDLGHVKLSIGAARLRIDDDEQSWFVRADKLLYQAKDGGRNSVVVEHFR